MTLLIIVLGLLPSFAWLFFYLKEDLHPEPKKLIALTFFAGIVFGFFALLVETGLDCGYAKSQNLDCFVKRDSAFTSIPLLVIDFALIEELAKFGAAYFTVRKKSAFDEPVDAMIYTTVAALGFAALENLGAISQASKSFLEGNIFAVTSLRFIGATLLHALTSALAGYFWAKSIREFGAKRFIFLGLVLATLLHTVFNYLIIIFGNPIYVIIFLAIVGFFTLNDFEKLKGRKV